MAAKAKWLDRIATRRLAGWGFVLVAVSAIPSIVTYELADSAVVTALLSIIGLAFIAPAYLYLGRRLTPMGGGLAMRLAALYVVVSALDAAAWIVVLVAPSVRWVADAMDFLAIAALVPFVWLMAAVARGDPALPWLRTLRVAVTFVAVGLPLLLSIDLATDDISLAFLFLVLLVAASLAVVFVFVWSFVVGRRLLREERRERGVASA